jgi:hypothetical protein
VRISPSSVRITPEPLPAWLPPVTSSSTTDGSTAAATFSTLPSAAVDDDPVSFATVRGDAEDPPADDVSSPEVAFTRAAPPTPAAPPTSSAPVRTNAANRVRCGLRGGGGGSSEECGGCDGGGPNGGVLGGGKFVLILGSPPSCSGERSGGEELGGVFMRPDWPPYL